MSKKVYMRLSIHKEEFIEERCWSKLGMVEESIHGPVDIIMKECGLMIKAMALEY
jgi:hypothetical protein